MAYLVVIGEVWDFPYAQERVDAASTKDLG